MNQDELDEKLRVRFIDALDSAHKYASEKRDVEALGQLAQLIGTCIDWDKEKAEEHIVMGFQPKEKEDKDE